MKALIRNLVIGVKNAKIVNIRCIYSAQYVKKGIERDRDMQVYLMLYVQGTH